MMRYSVVNSKTRQDIDVIAKESLHSKSTPELFSDFYRLQNNDAEPSPRHMELLKKVLEEMEGENK